MFEVLLQADKAMASGDLDQAERSYWQLIELDPTNAIAMTGLACVSIERGDRRLARTLADRALAIDPESVVGRKILAALDGGGDVPGRGQPDLTLMAAQRLEELGKKRVIEAEAHARADSHRKGHARHEAGSEASHDHHPAKDATFPQLPAEPLAKRRQAGRQAAPSAAAVAAGPARLASQRPRTHHALGERAFRRLLPEDIKLSSKSADPFAAAESAAAVEAVDATDDLAIPEPPLLPKRGAAETAARTEVPRRPVRPKSESEEKLDALAEDESVAMRLAFLSEAAAEPAAEPEATTAEPSARASKPIDPDLAAAEAEAEAAAEAVTLVDVASDEGAALEATEEDAEDAALKEALALVLGGEAASGDEAGTADRAASRGARTRQAAEKVAEEPEAAGPGRTVRAGSETAQPEQPKQSGPMPAPELGPAPESGEGESPRKKGFLGRWRRH